MNDVKYKCVTCNKNFKQKIDFIRHENRKNKCGNLSLKFPHKNAGDDNKVLEQLHTCNFCKHTFTKKWNLYRHYNRCKVIIAEEKLKEELFNKLLKENGDLKKENEEMKHKMCMDGKGKNITIIKNNTTNNINIQNNIQNIQNNKIYIVAYGKEDLTKLSKEDILKVLSRGYNSVIELTEKIHFNPKFPENHNIYIPNIKEKYVMIYDGNNWNLALRSDTIDDLYDTKKECVEENMRTFYESLDDAKRNALQRWLDTPDDDKKINKIREDIKLMLFNKRDMVINNKLITQ